MLAVRLFRAEFTALADEKIVLSGSDSMLSFSASFTRTQTALVVEQPANMNSIIDFGFKQLPPKGLRATKKRSLIPRSKNVEPGCFSSGQTQILITYSK